MIVPVLLWNIMICILMGYDKWKSIHLGNRIPEKTFLILMLLFGSSGILFGMLIFHHKIRKPKFYITAPLLFSLQIYPLIKLANIC